MEQAKTENHERTKDNHIPKTDSTQHSNAANDSKTSTFSEDSSKSEDSNSNTSNTTSNSGASSTVDPNMDIDTPCYFYQDALGLKQGPFSFKEMFLWWKGGYFADTLLVRTIWEDHMIPLIQIPQFWNAPIKLVERIEKEHEESLRRGVEIPAVNYSTEETSQASTDAPKYETYVVTGGFNPITGKFQKDDSSSHFASKGLPADRDSRMMAHYFDYNQYAQQMAAAAQEPKKKKQVKGSKKFWKDRKEKKKRAKLLAEYLAD